MSVRNSIRDAIRSAIGLVEEVFNPQTLFLSGERGVWYEPSDLSTLFQDAAGTIPVTGTGQPVGLMLDKRLGLVRGAGLVSDGHAFLSGTGSFSGGRAILGAGAVLRVKFPLASFAPAFTRYEVQIASIASPGAVLVDLVDGPVGQFSGVGPRSMILTPLTAYNDTYRFLDFVAPAGATFDLVSVRALPGNHAAQQTAASRPIFRDVGGLRYLECDGVDDGMVTGSIDFTGTDKMLAVVGVRKLSDAASGAPIGLGVNQTGSFELVTCTSFGGTRNSYQVSVGAAEVSKVAYRPFAAPISNVLSCVLDTTLGSASTEITTRFDGTLVAPTNTIGSVTGNFGNYPLYLFRRDGTTLPFNGLFYGAIIAGSTYSAAQIASAERYLAGKSGVTL